MPRVLVPVFFMHATCKSELPLPTLSSNAYPLAGRSRTAKAAKAARMHVVPTPAKIAR